MTFCDKYGSPELPKRSPHPYFLALHSQLRGSGPLGHIARGQVTSAAQGNS